MQRNRNLQTTAIWQAIVAPTMCAALLATGFCFAPAVRAGTPGMSLGPVELSSVGPMTFTDSGVLLVADPMKATIHAIDLEIADVGPSDSGPGVNDLPAAIRESLGLSSSPDLGELAVDPSSRTTVVSFTVDDAVHLVLVDVAGKIAKLDLDKVNHASKVLPDAPADREIVRRGRTSNPRSQSITDIAFFEGKVMVTGMASGDDPSRVLEMSFPFAQNGIATSVEIFHAAHGRVEDATIRTFLPMIVDGKPNLLAGFTCTPLVRFPVNSLGSNEKVRGTTVAELGNRNSPLDMIVYDKDGQTSILMTNTVRGVMKIKTDGIAQRDGLTERVDRGAIAGQPFETVASLGNIKQMDKLDDQHLVAIVDEEGTMSLKTLELP